MGEFIDKAKGMIKEVVGEVTGNKELKREGEVDQIKGQFERTVKDVKSTVKDTTEDVKNVVKGAPETIEESVKK